MVSRKPDIELDVSPLLLLEPSPENLVRVKKALTILHNNAASLEGLASTWEHKLGIRTNSVARKDTAGVFDGTFRALVEDYHTRRNSPYHALRHTSRSQSDTMTQIIVEDFRNTKIADVTEEQIRQVHAEWKARVARKGRSDGTSMAHSLVTHLRIIVNYGVKELQDSGCLNLSFILRHLKLKAPKPRENNLISNDQVKAIIVAAHEMGVHSVALAQAFQFECQDLSQKDVIGEWVPIDAEGTSDIMNGDEKWLHGLRWNEIDENMILTHIMSRFNQPIKIDLKTKPLVMDELKRSANPRSGPVIVCEQNQLPWWATEFRRMWRKIAREAGVPDDVFNMNSRIYKYSVVRAAKYAPKKAVS